jgi:hypothetical protein
VTKPNPLREYSKEETPLASKNIKIYKNEMGIPRVILFFPYLGGFSIQGMKRLEGSPHIGNLNIPGLP